MSGLMRTRWAAIGAAVAVTLGAGGISLTHAVIDSGVKNVLVPVEPCRLVDNRTAPDTVGPSDDPLPAGTPVTFDSFGANGNCVLPASFEGLLINVTPVNATANTDIRLYPTGGPPPLSSNLNPEAGTLPVPNLVSVGVSNAGQFDVLNKFGTVNIVIDVLAYYDDHNHDDRYYTQDEIDPGHPDAVAGFLADGAVRSGGAGVSGVTYEAANDRYRVSFDDFSFSVNDDVAMVVARSEGVIASYSSVGGDLLVFLEDAAGTPLQRPFSIVVWDSAP